MKSPATNPALTPLILQSSAGLQVEILPFGATISSILLNGQELTLRHAYPDDYLNNEGYLGSTIGRYANRIANGQLQFNGKLWQLDTAGAGHCLHGGHGFSHHCWQVLRQATDEVELFLYSPDGDSGFPGDLSIWQTIKVSGTDIQISFRATTESSTVVSLTNHCYFNLDGSRDTTNHLLQIYSDRFLPVNAELIPTGVVQSVIGSAFDFQTPVRIAENLALPDPQLAVVGGYDHCFIFDTAPGFLRPMATLTSKKSNITLTVSSTMPGLQFYGGQALTAPFSARQGLCLEAQSWPDAPNHPDFPSTLLRKGESYQQQIVYAFSKGGSTE
jgi:aldose 1-epimerase